MKNKKIKNILSVGLLSTIGLLFSAKTLAQKPEYENKNYKEKDTIKYHCKFIKNNAEIVVNYTDTFTVFDIYETVESGKKQVICDLGPLYPNLICNIDYYKDAPWFPVFQSKDTFAYKAIEKDLQLVKQYYDYQNAGDYEKRDSVELLLLANRKQLIDKVAQNQK